MVLAEGDNSVTASVTVLSACTLTGTVSSGNEHTASVLPGSYTTDIGTTNIKAICNDSDGFDIYAVGWSGTTSDINNTADVLTATNTSMVSSNGLTIATGLNTDTNPGNGNSNWAMKLSLVSPYNAYTPNILSDTNGSYADYHVVPATSTKVVSFNASTDNTSTNLGSNVNTTYAAYINKGQLAGTYVGQVKYTLTHPNTSFSLYMQDFTEDMCTTLGTSTEKYVTLYDKRDNNSYQVSYINGQCWMTQNLRITGTVPSNGSNFSGQDIDISVNDLTAGNSYTEPRTHVGVDNNNNPTAWYNYCAASAKTICTDRVTVDTAQDICPLGWHLPSGPNTTIGSDLNTLIGNSDINWQEATQGLTDFKAVSGGFYRNNTLNNPDLAYWWTATVASNTDNYRLGYSSSGVYGGTSNVLRYSGFYVRCVMETRDLSDITYMQEVSPSIIRNTAEGTTATLTDRRDNNTYSVAKINGDLWMTQNLRIAAGTTLTSIDSNVVTSYTIPTTDSSSSAYSATADLTSGNSYTEGRTHTGVDSNNNPTMWYNYCATTAGTICNNTTAGDANADICPSGWRLPKQNGAASSVNSIIGNESDFLPVTGGCYGWGSLGSVNRGYWWTASQYDTSNQYYYVVDDGAITLHPDTRTYGFFIRCVTN